jgi:hypothetical protein
MTPEDLLQLLPGPFNFLRRDPAEVRALMPDAATALPRPNLVYLDDEGATPVRGFPVLISPGAEKLQGALERYLLAEEEAQVAILRRRPSDRKALTTAREGYRGLLVRAVVNATLSSYGRSFPGVFWLQHSLDAARVLKDTPRRVLRADLEIGRDHGSGIKYRVLERYLGLALTECYEVASRLAVDTEEVEEALFPRLLGRLRDNVLLFTEDHIGADLAELGAYFQGYLHIDGRDLRQRLDELAAWSDQLLASEPEVRAAVRHLLRPERLTPTSGEPDPAERGRELLVRPGWLRYLASRADYPADRLPGPGLVEVWESLLLKLKEFELVHGLRACLLPVRREGEALVCRPAGVGQKSPARAGATLSAATRPFDFAAPWVVDPLVHRFGLIYDLTDFSDIVNILRRSGSEIQDDAFRRMFTFQRRINRLATAHRVHLEKYLGDGAFYSSRNCAAILFAAMQVQRAYRQALEDGFPFDRGLRIALNYGQYRLIPMGTGGPEGPERYEFFGHGLVELSRLITGKATREIEEIKTMLVAQGYPEATVYRFFSPMLQRNPEQEGDNGAGGFYAFINRNGNLVNEGIVATEAFVRQLDRELGPVALGRAFRRDRRYVVIALEREGGRVEVALRKLGLAHLKGLGEVPVFEVVDGDLFEAAARAPLGDGALLQAVEGFDDTLPGVVAP